MTGRSRMIVIAGATVALAVLVGSARVIAPYIRAVPFPGRQVEAPPVQICPGRTPLLADEILRVGARVTPPQRLVYVPPRYPVAAMASRVRGVVIIEAVVDRQGVVRTTRVLRSIEMLDDAAIDAVCQWVFAPARVNGEPIGVAIPLTVDF